MKLDEAFASSSKHLKAEDLGPIGTRVVVTIDKLSSVKFDGETKPVLHFRGKEKTLILNKTNGYQIAGITGTEEMDEWSGHRITLYSTKVLFEGKMVPAIRVEDPPFDRQAAPPPPPTKQSVPEDDIPF